MARALLGVGVLQLRAIEPAPTNDAPEPGDVHMTLRLPSAKVVRAAITCFIAAVAALHLAYYFPRVVDDLFISLRYAENLAEGNGAVYNIGEKVEGYSSPIWMLLQALGLRLGFEGVLFTKALGVASFAFLFVGLHRVARDVMRIGPWASFIPLAWLAANSYVVNWTVLGLETPLHLAALVWTIVWLRAFDADSGSSAASTSSAPRRTTAFAALSMIVLGLSRPESPMLLAILVAESILVAPRSTWLSRIKARGPALLVVAGVLGLGLAVRWSYYHDVFANTYYVKGKGAHFALSKLGALHAEGVGRFERVVFIVGAVLVGLFGVMRRRLGPFLATAAVIAFTTTVELDWMPSLRHLLPVTILAPLGVAAAIDVLVPGSRDGRFNPLRHGGAAVALSVVAIGAVEVARLDNRLSPAEASPGRFRKAKSWEKWNDTLLAYRRVEPPHVKAMGDYETGQITQVWGVLEACSEPIASSWFVGRDIGAVGYYTGVRVYDTAGLVTREVSHAEPWMHRREVTDEMAQLMMERNPLAGEVYEGWDTALGRNPELLGGYRIRFGGAKRPHGFVATNRVPPSREEKLARYRSVVDKFPRAFHLHTLYGESVGAVVERRYRIVST